MVAVVSVVVVDALDVDVAIQAMVLCVVLLIPKVDVLLYVSVPTIMGTVDKDIFLLHMVVDILKDLLVAMTMAAVDILLDTVAVDTFLVLLLLLTDMVVVVVVASLVVVAVVIANRVPCRVILDMLIVLDARHVLEERTTLRPMVLVTMVELSLRASTLVRRKSLTRTLDMLRVLTCSMEMKALLKVAMKDTILTMTLDMDMKRSMEVSVITETQPEVVKYLARAMK